MISNPAFALEIVDTYRPKYTSRLPRSGLRCGGGQTGGVRQAQRNPLGRMGRRRPDFVE
jgi:hypothetical protein